MEVKCYSSSKSKHLVNSTTQKLKPDQTLYLVCISIVSARTCLIRLINNGEIICPRLTSCSYKNWQGITKPVGFLVIKLQSNWRINILLSDYRKRHVFRTHNDWTTCLKTHCRFARADDGQTNAMKCVSALHVPSESFVCLQMSESGVKLRGQLQTVINLSVYIQLTCQII